MKARKKIDLKTMAQSPEIDALIHALGTSSPRSRQFVASGKVPSVNPARAPWARQFTASGKAVGKIPQ